MEEANEGRRKALMERASLKLDNYPRDLLQRFMTRNPNQSANKGEGERGEEEDEEEEDSKEIELNLGLSLGGKFGVNKSTKKQLIRSSSIAGCSVSIHKDSDDAISSVPQRPGVIGNYPSLIRSSSLPVEAEEEWRKRKELQMLRRLAAKRRRSEKQRNSGAAADWSCFPEEQSKLSAATFGFPVPATTASMLDLINKLKGSEFEGLGQQSSQGSGELLGDSSSGASKSESKPVQGTHIPIHTTRAFVSFLLC